MDNPVLPVSFVKTVLSPLNGLGTIVKNPFPVHAEVYSWTSCSIPCLFLCQCDTVLITVALSEGLKPGSVSLSALFFSSKVVLAVWGPLKSHMNFRTGFSISAKMSGILIETALNL